MYEHIIKSVEKRGTYTVGGGTALCEQSYVTFWQYTHVIGYNAFLWNNYQKLFAVAFILEKSCVVPQKDFKQVIQQ